MTLEMFNVTKEEPKLPKGIIYFLANPVEKKKKPERDHVEQNFILHDHLNPEETQLSFLSSIDVELIHTPKCTHLIYC